MDTNADERGPILLVGWDGAPHELVEDLLESGNLPTLSGLADEGYFGPLKTVPYVMSSCAWSTFLTGKNAGKHGIFDFYANEFREGTYFREPIDGRNRDAMDLGELLNDRERTIGQVNVPMTYPASKVDDFVVTGMLTPGVDSEGFVHPTDFLEDFEGFEDYKIDVGEGKDADRDTFLEAVETTVESRMDLTLYCLSRGDYPDVFFVVFTCPDRLSHYFFHFYDESHPFRVNESEGNLEEYADVLPELYRELDARLADLIDTVNNAYDEEPLTCVVSDHGMRSLKRIFHVNKWLAREGYLTFKHRFDNLDNISKELDDRVEYIFGKVDWERTDAYSMGKRGAIYVNLEGREPAGSVPPEKSQTVVASLREDLAEIVDPDTGENVVEAIQTRDELFHGDNVERAPDVLLRLSEGYYPFGYAFELESPGVFSTNDWPDMPFVTGIEDGDGIMAVSGPGIDGDTKNVNVGLVDFIPFLLHYLDESVPTDMDGSVPTELFEQAGDVEYEDSGPEHRDGEDGSGAADERVKDRLKDLGYL